MRPVLIFCATIALGGPVVAAEAVNPAAEYAACMTLAAERPMEAFERAGQWQGLGGGVPAEHCRAAALMELGEEEAAATALEDLAQSSRTSAEIKVGMLRHAAEGWRRAGQDDRAFGVLDAALRIAPASADTLEDRAVLNADADRLWNAVDDLNAALEAEPGRVSALVLRAAAYRRLETFDLAQADLDRALSIDPNAPEVLLERGALAQASGRPDAARQDWMRILRAAPDSPAAEVARGNLERLDVKVR
jgi:tetratricopeptide (TPR) repeat protein